MTETLYHVGLLMKDRKIDKELDARATELWKRAMAGQVVLYQRRVDRELGVCGYYWRPMKGAK